MAEKKIFTSLAFQSGAKLIAPKVEARTPLATLTDTTDDDYYTGSAGQLAYNNGNIWVNNDSIWTKLLNHKTSATISGGFTFDRVDGNDAGIAPFIIGSSSQHKFVAGLQAETLGTNSATLADGTHGISDTATEHGIPVYGASGVLKVGTPLSDDDAANRGYVDNAVQGLDHKESVKYATTGNLSSISGTGTISGVDGSVAAGDRILVKNQATSVDNGIYVATPSGDWNRATDADESGYSNLVDFTSAGTSSGWSATDSDTAVWNSSGKSSGTYYFTPVTPTLVAGKTYKATLTITNYSGSGVLGMSSSGGVGSSLRGTTNTTVSVYFVANGDPVKAFGLETNNATIDLTIKETDLTEGAFVFVESGDTLANSSWVLSDIVNHPPAQTWTQFSAAGQITAGDGLTKSGDSGTLSVNVAAPISIVSDNVTIADDAILSAHIDDGQITPAHLVNSSSFTMGGLTVNGTATIGGALSISANTTPSTAGGESFLYKHSNNGTVLSGYNASIETGSAGSRVVNLSLTNAGKLGLGADANSPSGTLHISTARYGSNIFEAANTSWGTDVSNATAFDSAYVWNAYQTSGIEVDNNALTMTTGATGRGIYTTGLALTAGKTYVIKLATGAISGATYKVFVRDTNGSYVSIGTLVASTTNTFTFTAQTGSYTGALYIYQDGSGSGSIVLNASSVTNELKEDTLTTAGTLSVNSAADDLVIANNDHGGLSIITPADKKGIIFFGDKNDNDRGGIKYDHAENDSVVATDERMEFSVNGDNKALTLHSDLSAKFESGIGSGGRIPPANGTYFGGDGYKAIERVTNTAASAALIVQKSGTGWQSNGNDIVAAFKYNATAGTVPDGSNILEIGSQVVALTPVAGVAIGNTDTNAKLDVTSAAFDQMRLSRSHDGNTYDWDFKVATTGFIALQPSVAADFRIRTNNGTEAFTVLSDGNVNQRGNSIVNSASIAGLQDSGACYDFDGTDNSVSFTTPAPFSGNGLNSFDATLSAWAKFNSIGQFEAIVCLGAFDFEIAPLNSDNNEVGIYINDAAWTGDNFTPTVGEWNHYVATKNGNTYSLYVNGVLIGTATDADNGTVGTTSHVGRNGSTAYFDGQIRDVKIFPSALTEPEVRKLYSGENPKKNGGTLIPNGTFDNSNGWAVSGAALNAGVGTWNIANGVATIFNNSGATRWLYPSTTFTIGKLYRFTFDLVSRTAGNIYVAFTDGSASTSAITTVGTHTFVGKCTGNNNIYLRAENGFVGDVDNIIISEVDTLVDFTPQSASSTQWRNEAIPSLYNGTVNNATLSQGNTYWNNIKQSSDGVELSNLGIGTAPTTWDATISDGTTTGFINAYNNALSFGTNTDHALKLYQNGTVAFQLDADGNSKVENKLGVGGVASSCQLRVVGTSEFENAIYLGTASGSKGMFGWTNMDSSPGTPGDHTHLVIAGSADATNAGILFQTRNTSTVDAGVISREGYWGIGHSAPNRALHVKYVDTNTNITNFTVGKGLSIENDSDTLSTFASLEFRAHNADGRIGYQYVDNNKGSFFFRTDGVGDLLKLNSDGTHDHHGNRIVNSQTLNDSWRTSEPSLRFDGSDVTSGPRVDLGTDLIGVSDVTITAWIKTKAYGTIAGFAYIVDNQETTFYVKSDGKLHLDRDSQVSSAANSFPSTFHGKWVHVAVTSTAAGATNFFINGLLSGTANQDAGTATAGATNTFIGNNAAGNRTFDGEIKDVRIHNRALDADEIKGLYNGESTPWKYANAGVRLDGDINWTNGFDTPAITTSDGFISGGSADGESAYKNQTFSDQQEFKVKFTVSNGESSNLYFNFRDDSNGGGSDTGTIESSTKGTVNASKNSVQLTQTGDYVIIVKSLGDALSYRFVTGADVGSITITHFSIEHLGEVAAYTPQSIGGKPNGANLSGYIQGRWADTTSNGNHGDITGATVVNPNVFGAIEIRGSSDANSQGNALTIRGGLTGNDRLDLYHDLTTAYVSADSSAGSGYNLQVRGKSQLFKTYVSGWQTRLEIETGNASGAAVKATSATSTDLKQVARGFTTNFIQPTGKAFTSFRIDHNLGTQFIHVSVIEDSGNQEVVECAIRTGSWTQGQTGANIADCGSPAAATVTGVTSMGTQNNGTADGTANDASKKRYSMVTFAAAPAVGTNYKVVVTGI